MNAPIFIAGLLAVLAGTAATASNASETGVLCQTYKGLIPQGLTPSSSCASSPRGHLQINRRAVGCFPTTAHVGPGRLAYTERALLTLRRPEFGYMGGTP